MFRVFVFVFAVQSLLMFLKDMLTISDVVQHIPRATLLHSYHLSVLMFHRLNARGLSLQQFWSCVLL